MLSSNKWIAFWFASLILNVVSLNKFEGIDTLLPACGAVTSAWFFMSGVMEVVRPSR